MSDFKGFFDLQEPKHLLAKLKHDYERLRNSPEDTYAAFDFFVTGYHMLDWLYPGKEGEIRRTQEEADNVILQVCSHIANGIKHFEVTAKKHKTIGYGDVAFDDEIDVRSLVFTLTGPARNQFGFKKECIELATAVLEYWKNHPLLKEP